MNLLQELQARTAAANQSTDEEVESIYSAIHAICLRAADMGKDNVFVHTDDVVTDVDCRDAAQDDAFMRAMARVANNGVTVRPHGSNEHLFMLLWEA